MLHGLIISFRGPMKVPFKDSSEIDQEVAYLKELSQKLGRKLTDSEVFGFSQVNSEHCRHKIFNGVFRRRYR